ncbi:unnamed protein product [Protopolystoma xenopodis]|uniref:Uncharacterized protein n=1 Tax=Protopolystoma xenopodis TaxID=117903 RepID=A0A448XFD9_9PLAT|nr:unnamed protein product [Protopolystoma xenopodis]
MLGLCISRQSYCPAGPVRRSGRRAKRPVMSCCQSEGRSGGQTERVGPGRAGPFRSVEVNCRRVNDKPVDVRDTVFG